MEVMNEKERIILTLETAIGILTPQECEPRTEEDWCNFAVSVRAMLQGLIDEMNEAKPLTPREDEMTERECERHVGQLRRVNEQLRAENADLKKMQARVREALGLPPYAEKVIPER